MGRVHIYPSLDYEYHRVKKAVYRILEGSEFHQKLFPGAKVLIKANLLMKKSPDEAVTTHPMVIQTIAEYLIEKSAEPIIADSPAGPFTISALRGIYKACGMQEASEASGAVLNEDVSFTNVCYEQAERLKRFDILNVVLKADFVISAAKLKTHGMMTFTGAVKNLFGVIPGLTKAEYHFKLREKESFALHLIDIERFVKPDFSIIDAVDCMEGNGPSNGQKRHVGLILGADNPYEVDQVAAEIASIPTASIPTLYLAQQRGYWKLEEVERTGCAFRLMEIRPFILPSSVDIIFGLSNLPKPVHIFLMEKLRSKPIFKHQQCISCGHCIRNCPAGIIRFNKNNKPQANLKECISCFCCHEVCPADAIDIKRPLLLRLMKGLK